MNTSFAWTLWHYRKRSGLSQAMLARRCGYDHSYISRLEAGTRLPSKESANRISRELQLLGEDEVRFQSAAGFVVPGGSIVTRPVLTEIDLQLSNPQLPDSVQLMASEQLHSLHRMLDAVIAERRSAA